MIELTKERKSKEGVKKFLVDWMTYTGVSSLQEYQCDISIKKLNSKLRHLNKRKLKKALTKSKGFILKNVYPVNVSEYEATEDTTITLDVNFQYDKQI